MIHRQNWLDVRHYLRFLSNTKQNDIETVRRYRSHLRHLLEWADETPLPQARSVDPALQTYLLSARADGQEKHLAPYSIVKCLASVRPFFNYARTEWPHRYKSISQSWISMLYAPRIIRSSAALPVHILYDIEEVLKIARVSTETLTQERGKVAACMLFVSNMRAEALATIRIYCVDVPNRTLMQYPLEGVRTKNSKAALTYMLRIPELLEVCQKWDDRVRSTLPSNSLWYSNVSPDGMSLKSTPIAFHRRHDVVEKDLAAICELAGVPYKSPHKLRHGHFVYALKQARSVAELKAISQNGMHESMATTEAIYGNLVHDDIKSIIDSLGAPQDEDAEVLQFIEMVKRKLENDR